MHQFHEALAKEHLRQLHAEAAHARLCREALQAHAGQAAASARNRRGLAMRLRLRRRRSVAATS